MGGRWGEKMGVRTVDKEEDRRVGNEGRGEKSKRSSR